MKKLFFLITAVIISVTGCAGFSGETSGTSGGAGTGNSFNPPSDIYFG